MSPYSKTAFYINRQELSYYCFAQLHFFYSVKRGQQCPKPELANLGLLKAATVTT